MFLLTPTYFNSKLMKHDTENIYTVTFPVEEMNKFETSKDLDDFLYYHYDNIFFQKEIRKTTMLFELYFQKKTEETLTKKEN